MVNGVAGTKVGTTWTRQPECRMQLPVRERGSLFRLYSRAYSVLLTL
jgi:hypothetical protein